MKTFIYNVTWKDGSSKTITDTNTNEGESKCWMKHYIGALGTFELLDVEEEEDTFENPLYKYEDTIAEDQEELNYKM